MSNLPRIALLGASCLVAGLFLLAPACGGTTKTSGGSGGAAGTAAGGTGATAGTGGAGASSGTGGSSSDTCAVDTDCTWGEIPKEILKAQDCMCLFGCVYLPQTKTTARRRETQYATLCTPGKDGAGQPCPVDDCALPGAIACIAGSCQAAPTDAGPAR